MAARAESFDDYMATVPEPQRAALQSLRETIHAAAPGAEECISYQMPSFRLDGACWSPSRPGSSTAPSIR